MNNADTAMSDRTVTPEITFQVPKVISEVKRVKR